jgi:hypothetical protein
MRLEIRQDLLQPCRVLSIAEDTCADRQEPEKVAVHERDGEKQNLLAGSREM